MLSVNVRDVLAVVALSLVLVAADTDGQSSDAGNYFGCSSVLDFACLKTAFVKNVLSNMNTGKTIKLWDGLVEVERVSEEKKDKRGKVYGKDAKMSSKSIEDLAKRSFGEAFDFGFLGLLRSYAVNLNLVPGFRLQLTHGRKSNSLFNIQIQEANEGEARGKMKRMYPILMFLLFKAALIPVVMMIIKALAFKALIVNKLAFLFSAFSSLKAFLKLSAQNQGYQGYDYGGYQGYYGGDYGHDGYLGSETHQAVAGEEYSAGGSQVAAQQQASHYAGSSSQISASYAPQASAPLTSAVLHPSVGLQQAVADHSVAGTQTVLQQAVPYSQTVVGQLSSPYLKTMQASPYTQAITQQATAQSQQAIQQISPYAQQTVSTAYAPAVTAQVAGYPQAVQQQGQTYNLNAVLPAQKKSTSFVAQSLKRRKTS